MSVQASKNDMSNIIVDGLFHTFSDIRGMLNSGDVATVILGFILLTGLLGITYNAWKFIVKIVAGRLLKSLYNLIT